MADNPYADAPMRPDVEGLDDWQEYALYLERVIRDGGTMDGPSVRLWAEECLRIAKESVDG